MFIGFESFDLMREYYENHSTRVFAGVYFSNSTSYSISMDNMNLPATNSIHDDAQSVNDDSNTYITSGMFILISFSFICFFFFFFYLKFAFRNPPPSLFLFLFFCCDLTLSKGFLGLQLAIDEALLGVLGNISSVKLNVQANQYPGTGVPMWKQWQRSSGLGQAGAIFFLIAFFVSQII